MGWHGQRGGLGGGTPKDAVQYTNYHTNCKGGYGEGDPKLYVGVRDDIKRCVYIRLFIETDMREEV